MVMMMIINSFLQENIFLGYCFTICRPEKHYCLVYILSWNQSLHLISPSWQMLTAVWRVSLDCDDHLAEDLLVFIRSKGPDGCFVFNAVIMQPH
jgi:hypothetical protein